MGAENLYRRLLSIVDDYGRFHGAPLTVRAACWPTCPEKVTDQQVSEWLNECSGDVNPLVRFYLVNEVRYLEITRFGQKVRTLSKFPAPSDGSQPEGPSLGSVYFIRAVTTHRVKIGFTELDPVSRLATLQIGSPEKLELIGSLAGSMADERAIHKQFANQRQSGEWFTLSPEIQQFISLRCVRMPQNAAECAKKPALVGVVVRSRNAESESESSLYSAYRRFIEAWTAPTDDGKVFTCGDVDLGYQMWSSLIDKGTITEASVGEIFAGLDRHRGSKKWRDGFVLSVPAFLGWSKNGIPAAPRWNDRPEPAATEGDY